MSREWKPGDLALVECSDGEYRMSWCGENLHGLVWLFPGGVYRIVNESHARPLVVIDPEDDGQIDRLYRLLVEQDHTYDKETPRELRHALREFANPTPAKPDEPLGLGAVVEDGRNCRWIRHGNGPRAWMLAGASPDNRDTYAYDDTFAVRVLSPGYTEDGAS